jgi:hypothetical protein
LCLATPRRWLADGCDIKVDRAPTAFGDVSMKIHSDLKHKRLDADLMLPASQPDRTLIRFRLPDGYRVDFADVEGHPHPVERNEKGETLDLSGLTGAVHIVARLKK